MLAGIAAFEAAGAAILVAVGGGSPQDTCKTIGIVVTNPESSDVVSLEGVAETRNPSVPIVAVPTTAGTAAEVTVNYVITDADAPHGVANGVLLASVMEYNASHTGDRLRDVAVALGVEGAADLPLDEARAAAVETVRRLVVDLGSPTTLRDLGVTEDALHDLADAALADVCAGGNPRPATREDVHALYRSLP